MKGRSCIVVGYGFVGGYLVNHLIAQGAEVTVIEKREGKTPPCKWIHSDIRFLDEKMEADYVFHLAGLSSIPHVESNPYEALESNLDSTVSALRKLKARKKFVFISSGAVYGPSSMPIPEIHQVAPKSFYGASKAAAEMFVAQGAKNYAIIRPFNMYGKGQISSFLIPQLITQASAGKIKLRNGATVRDYLYIEDAVNLMSLGAEEENPNLILNAASGIPRSTMEVARVVQNFFPESGLENEEKYDDFSPLRYTADIGLAKSLGWAPQIPLEEGIKRTIG